jgi:hypothetical protein
MMIPFHDSKEVSLCWTWLTGRVQALHKPSHGLFFGERRFFRFQGEPPFFFGRILDLEVIAMGGSPTEGDLESLVEVFECCIGGARERAVDGWVGNGVGAEMDA